MKTSELSILLKRWQTNLVVGFGEAVISPTLHEVIYHTTEFIEHYGCLQIFDESVCETSHHNQRNYYEFSNKTGNMEEYILVSTFLHIQ